MITAPELTTRPTEAVEPPKRHFNKKRVISLGVSVVLIVGIFYYVLPQIADVSTVRDEIAAMTWIELAILAGLAIWNLVTYWIVMVMATPGLKFRQAIVATEASTAVANTIPGGSAIAVGLTYKMLGSWGFSKSRTTVSLVVSGIWNNFVKLGMPILALALLAFAGNASGSRVIAGAIGIAALVAAVSIFAVILHSEATAMRAGERAGRMLNGVRRMLRKPPAEGWGEATLRFRNRVIGLVRRRWGRLTVTSLVGHLSLFVVLVAALRSVGVSETEVSWIEIMAVFAFVRLLTAIPITPGGLGIIEIGLITGIAAAGGEHAQVAAAVLVYRVLTFVLPIGLGVLSYVFWRRNRSWLDTAPPLDPAFSPAPTMATPVVATVG